MARPLISGRSTLIGFGITHPVPIPLDAAPYRGATVHGADGLIYASDGLTWRSMVDEARAAEIAEDVAANVFRLLTETITITVGPGPEIPGVNYNTLGAAIRYASGFIPASGALPVRLNILILSGVTLAEQVFIGGVDLSFVRIFAEDGRVLVLKSSIILTDPGNATIFPFLFVQGGGAPRVASCFDLTPPYNPATDPEYHMMMARGADVQFARFDGAGQSPPPTATLVRGGGAGWRHALRTRGGIVAMGGDLDNNWQPLWLQESVSVIGSGTTVAGYTQNGIRATSGTLVLDAGPASLGPGVLDLTRDGTVRTTDVLVQSGAAVGLNESATRTVQAGFNIPINTFQGAGFVSRAGEPNRTYSFGNVIGPVAFSGGVNAGALFEHGSGPNGSFRRTAEGFLECRHRLLVKPASDATPGNKAATWPLPAEFVGGASSIAVTITVDTTNPQLRGRVSGRALSNTEVDVRYFEDGAGTATDVFATVTARGRWRA